MSGFVEKKSLSPCHLTREERFFIVNCRFSLILDWVYPHNLQVVQLVLPGLSTAASVANNLPGVALDQLVAPGSVSRRSYRMAAVPCQYSSMA